MSPEVAGRKYNGEYSDTKYNLIIKYLGINWKNKGSELTWEAIKIHQI